MNKTIKDQFLQCYIYKLLDWYHIKLGRFYLVLCTFELVQLLDNCGNSPSNF